TNPLTNQTVTACHGIFTDAGGTNNNYSDNEDYIFTIVPPNATQISITFYSVNIESGYDTLFVYDGNSVSSPLLAAYSGTYGALTLFSSTGSITFRFKSDYATTATGWYAVWTSYGGNCDLQPTTYTNPGCIWKTSDFIQNFTDNESTGTGFKNRFYDVLYLNNGTWTANGNLGFFNDNFEQTMLDTVWENVAGNWILSNTHLLQQDETSANTILSAKVTQDSLHSYLYHWSMAMEGSGTNRRAGLYFSCDSGNTANRGNSYMAWYRLDNDLIQLYKVHDNSVYDLMTNDYYDFTVNTWYDFKIYFNPQTGEVSTYINDIKVSSFIDTIPYQHGNYISLRTGNASVWYDDIKVYSSRSASEIITLGNDSTKMVRTQNPNPQTKACRIKTMVMDGYDHFSTLEGNELNIDWTSPSAVNYVIDGTTTDIDTTNNPNQLSAHWGVTHDTNSGLSAYLYAIGTFQGGTDLLNWTSNNLDSSITASGFLSLQNNTTYYFSVKGVNAAGLQSSPISSDGQHTILAPIISFDANHTTVCNADSVHFQNNTLFADSYYWQFDGGSPTTSNQYEPVVYYQTPGTYNVSLIATSTGGTDTLLYSGFITVGETPVAAFSVLDSVLYQPQPVATFLNSSTGADSYLWNFGDGTTSTDVQPWHIYQDTGYFTVTLVAVNNICGNDTFSAPQIVHITENNAIALLEQNWYLTVLPNPFHDKFTISLIPEKSMNITITLSDITGKTVKRLYKGQTGKEFHLTIDKQIVKQGVYLLKIKTNDDIIIKKIIKQ
ncbi:MAG: hypothetical protein DRP35_07345, partial [Candidatus Zixiibacteriota bacterium]